VWSPDYAEAQAYQEKYGISRKQLMCLGGVERFDKMTELGREIITIIARLEHRKRTAYIRHKRSARLTR
jgi:hypothetical protein